MSLSNLDHASKLWTLCTAAYFVLFTWFKGSLNSTYLQPKSWFSPAPPKLSYFIFLCNYEWHPVKQARNLGGIFWHILLLPTFSSCLSPPVWTIGKSCWFSKDFSKHACPLLHCHSSSLCHPCFSLACWRRLLTGTPTFIFSSSHYLHDSQQELSLYFSSFL